MTADVISDIENTRDAVVTQAMLILTRYCRSKVKVVRELCRRVYCPTLFSFKVRFWLRPSLKGQPGLHSS